MISFTNHVVCSPHGLLPDLGFKKNARAAAFAALMRYCIVHAPEDHKDLLKKRKRKRQPAYAVTLDVIDDDVFPSVDWLSYAVPSAQSMIKWYIKAVWPGLIVLAKLCERVAWRLVCWGG